MGGSQQRRAGGAAREGRKGVREREAKDLGRRWRARPSRHDPGASEPERKEELSAKFLKDTCSGCPGRLGWGQLFSGEEQTCGK